MMGDIPTARHVQCDSILIMSVPRRERTPERGPTSAGDLVAAALENIEMRAMGCGNVTGVPTGFPRFDELTDGLQPENLIVLGGLSGVDTTAFALTVAAHATLRATVPTLLFSLELSKSEAVGRLLASRPDIDAKRLRRELMKSSEGKHDIRSVAGRLMAAPLVIDDAAAPTLDDLRTKLQAFRHDERLFPKEAMGQRAFMILDSLRRVGPKRRGEPSERKIAKVICGLKDLAKEYQVAVLAISALNRNLERREDKRPCLSDLRGSGSIGCHADVVLFLHRRGDEYGEHDHDDCATDLIIAKHRSAPMTSLALTFNTEHLR
jgi:replicative DNA helicase